MGIFDAIRNYSETATANVARVYDGIHQAYDKAWFNAAVNVANNSTMATTWVKDKEAIIQNEVRQAATYFDNTGAHAIKHASVAVKTANTAIGKGATAVKAYAKDVGAGLQKGATQGAGEILGNALMKPVLALGAVYIVYKVLNSGKAQRYLS